MAFAAVFRQQAAFCRKLAAPLTAAVCEAAVVACDTGSATGRALIDWPGDAMADALPMRFTGGCNAMVRAGRAPELAALYPPGGTPDVAALVTALRALLADPARDAELCGWLAGPPQTNEVARAGALMPGMLAVADACRLPLRLFELGCSAGLNLNLDRFAYDLGGVVTGDTGSPVRIVPDWTGPPPPQADVTVVSRRGTDISPLDLADAEVRERLLAYVWPDQPERVVRAEAAIALARAFPPTIDHADAADWVEAHVAPQAGSVAMVFHSIAFQYFPPSSQARIAAHLAGLPASADAPVAWLRFEMDDPSAPDLPALRLTLWQGGAPTERLLARAHPHGRFVEWFA